MNAAKMEAELKKELGSAVLSARLQKRKLMGKKEHESVWLRIKRDSLRQAIQKIAEHGAPHLSCISGADLGEKVELLYHFTMDYGLAGQEFVVTLAVALDKKDLTIPTITDLIPGALLSEREKQEFLGVTVEGIPDTRRAFIADDIAKAHPWIKDDKETAKHAVHKHERGVAQ